MMTNAKPIPTRPTLTIAPVPADPKRRFTAKEKRAHVTALAWILDERRADGLVACLSIYLASRASEIKGNAPDVVKKEKELAAKAEAALADLAPEYRGFAAGWLWGRCELIDIQNDCYSQHSGLTDVLRKAVGIARKPSLADFDALDEPENG